MKLTLTHPIFQNRSENHKQPQNRVDHDQAQRLSDIGQQLRDARMKNSFSLGMVAAYTRIRTHLLQAIEEGEIDNLPEPIYTQGLIRQYADALGLNGEELANFFLPEPGEKTLGRSLKLLSLPQLRPTHLYLTYTLLIICAVNALSYLVPQSGELAVTQTESASGDTVVTPQPNPVTTTPSPPQSQLVSQSSTTVVVAESSAPTPAPAPTPTLELIDICRIYRGSATEDKALVWLQDKIPNETLLEFARLWRNQATPQTQSIRILDVCRYYRDLPNQNQALRWLQREIPVTILLEFEQKWNATPEVVVDIRLLDVCRFYGGTPTQKEAIEWLQTQIPAPTLVEFARLWRRPGSR